MKQKQASTKQVLNPCQPLTLDDNFEELYKQYAHKVYRTCLNMTNDSLDAQDFTQDIFMKVFLKRNSFQNRSSFSTWLYAISYHYCLDRLKPGKQLKTEPLPTDLTSHLSEDALLEESADLGFTDNVDLQIQAQQRAINQLPDHERALLLLKYETGLSIRAISKQYNISESAVKARLKRTRDKLQANQF
ncbi:RNA polymerase sigma factor [Spirosoma foliorum]|uniref:RNA polymerase sigma factor n=1 Tax=Spirosoma foliorum TaxID=2710596 RepID=A0A7G5H1V6_9BACT|nr:RNA polymerase sigma factor [Spirosoma foliorum]QMW05098.1 RNA polymerase sigma factor [Spirosoma foliorum]